MRPTILFAQPSIQPPGGGHGVAAWLIEALRDDYSITLATEDPPDLGPVNHYYGTSLREGDLTHPADGARRLRRTWAMLDLLPARMTRVRRALYLRWCRGMAPAFDLVISVRNEIDVGHRTIQYVHFPYRRHLYDVDSRRAAGRWRLASRMYESVTARLSGETHDGICRNLTLANSEWTAGVFREIYGSETRVEVLHPPVQGLFPRVSWDDRRNGFISLGRIHEQKRIVEMIEIVERVRDSGHPLTLDLVGSADQPGYYEHILRLAADRPWVTISLDVPRATLPAFIASFRYGLHGMAREHFGMAVAEMTAAGCIVFVPSDGGQVEIVDGDERLVYDSPDEASRKITRILEDESAQRELREKLRTRASRYSLDVFIARARAIVRDEVARS